MKNKIVYITVLIFSIVFVFLGNSIASTNMPQFDGREDDICYKAKIIRIDKRSSAAENANDLPFFHGVNIFFTAKMLSGDQKGETVIAVQNSDPEFKGQIADVQAGDTVLLAPNIQSDSPYPWLMREYVRTDTLFVLAGGLCILIILFGKMQGINTLISLAFTCISIFSVLVPAILTGKNIYFWSILTCCYIILMTLLLVNGANKKCLCAALGCICGVGTAGVFTFVADRMLKLTGMVDDDSLFLLMLNENTHIDLRAIIFAGILIGAVGAIMDVSISLSSSLHEISTQSDTCTTKALYRSGMNIGKDIMGTMANTLVLAYIGGSLSVTLLLIAYSSSMLSLFNREMIVVEVLQALAGSFGILLTIPLTSLIGGLLYAKNSLKPHN